MTMQWNTTPLPTSSESSVLREQRQSAVVYETEIGKVARIAVPCLSFLVFSPLDWYPAPQIIAVLTSILFLIWELRQLLASRGKNQDRSSHIYCGRFLGDSVSEKIRTAIWLMIPGAMVITMLIECGMSC